jgi:YegS/Rv2252/BmrU family lipid kinase
MMRVILNPMSRGGAGRALRPHIENALAKGSRTFDIVETTHSGHAVDLAAQAVRDGVKTVVAAGGDGTIHEVANGLLASSTTPADTPVLGIIPIGTGNDFAKVVPGCRTRDDALQTLLSGTPHRFDVGLVEWAGKRAWFVNAMGTGVDVEVVRQIKRLSRGTGALVYVQGLMRALAAYEPAALRITADGSVVDARVMIVAVANGRCVGGSFNICPSARPDDGRLDLCIVDELPLLGQLALVPRIIAGTHESSRRVRARRVQSVTFAATDGRALFFQLDGELHEPPGLRELTVRIEAGRLNIITREQ